MMKLGTKALLIGVCALLVFGMTGCTKAKNSTGSKIIKQEKTTINSYKGYEGIGYEPIYHIERNESMEKAIEKNKRTYEGDYNYDLLELLKKSPDLTLQQYAKTLDAIYGKFLYTYTSQYQAEETQLTEEFLETTINNLEVLQEIGKASSYKDKVVILDDNFTDTIKAMKDLLNNLDNKDYAEYLDYKGRARITLQRLIGRCSDEVILEVPEPMMYEYESKKFDSIEFELGDEVFRMREYMGAISKGDEALPDEDYITLIKRLEKIQKAVNENSTNKIGLEKVNKQFTLVYKEIDKSREITKNNYEKAAQQKGTNEENIKAIRMADINLAPKINILAVRLSDSDLF